MLLNTIQSHIRMLTKNLAKLNIHGFFRPEERHTRKRSRGITPPLRQKYLLYNMFADPSWNRSGHCSPPDSGMIPLHFIHLNPT